MLHRPKLETVRLGMTTVCCSSLPMMSGPTRALTLALLRRFVSAGLPRLHRTTSLRPPSSRVPLPPRAPIACNIQSCVPNVVVAASKPCIFVAACRGIEMNKITPPIPWRLVATVDLGVNRIATLKATMAQRRVCCPVGVRSLMYCMGSIWAVRDRMRDRPAGGP